MTIGSQLREARTVRNLTYADVSKVTKIQPWILQALEEDRANESISPVYAKGFLSNYTRFLGMDLTEMAKRSLPAAPAPAPALAPAAIVAPIVAPEPEVAAPGPIVHRVVEPAVVAPEPVVLKPVPIIAPVVASAPVVAPEPEPMRVEEPVFAEPVAVMTPAPAVAPVIKPAPRMEQQTEPVMFAETPVASRSERKRSEPRQITITVPTFRLPRLRMPRVELPQLPRVKVVMPHVEMPSMQMPRIPLQFVARFAAVAATCAIIAGVIAADPLKHLPKIAWNRPNHTKVASVAPLPAAKAMAAKPGAEVKPAAPDAVKQPSVKAEAAKIEAKSAKQQAEVKESAAKEAAAAKVAVAKETAAKEATAKEQAAKPAAEAKPAAAPKPATDGKPAAQAAVAQPIIAANKPLELSISAKRNTWVQLWSDGKLLVQQRLRRGVEERWTANKRFEIIVANPSQVELVLNGTPITNAALVNEGRLLITHKGITRLTDTPS